MRAIILDNERDSTVMLTACISLPPPISLSLSLTVWCARVSGWIFINHQKLQKAVDRLPEKSTHQSWPPFSKYSYCYQETNRKQIGKRIERQTNKWTAEVLEPITHYSTKDSCHKQIARQHSCHKKNCQGWGLGSSCKIFLSSSCMITMQNLFTVCHTVWAYVGGPIWTVSKGPELKGRSFSFPVCAWNNYLN